MPAAALKKILPRPVLDLLRKHRIIVLHLLKNRRAQRQEKLHTPWVNLTPYDVDGRVAYSKEVYEDYFTWSGIPRSFVKGKRVLEIGPGENLAVSLRFLADGAAFVASVDRFRSLKSGAEQAAVYRRLFHGFDETQRKNLGDMLSLQDSGSCLDELRCRYCADTPLEALASQAGNNVYDLIVSRAVLEHVIDLDAAFTSMDRLLAPGGIMIHEVDFRDHGMFSDYGLNPLTYLTIREKRWNAMTSHTGAPNRKLKSDYERLLARHGYAAEVQIILIAGSNGKIHKKEIAAGVDYGDPQIDLVGKIRKKLAPQFRGLSDEELLVAGIFIVARKSQ
jgi:SAM-dependent methyltransferase